MPDCAVSQGVSSDYNEAKENAKTYEEIMQESLDVRRAELNKLEADFARLPPAVRRLTRGQARAVGLYF